jgi:hypothetical protein
MSPHLERRLLTRYASLFDGRRGAAERLEVGDGWFTLLDTLCALICWEHSPDRGPSATKRAGDGTSMREGAVTDDAVAGTRASLNCPEFAASLPVVHEVKEKFGSLRFYADGCNDAVGSYVMFAEYLSARICEVCGAPGERRDDEGWLQTLCDQHSRDRKGLLDD